MPERTGHYRVGNFQPIPTSNLQEEGLENELVTTGHDLIPTTQWGSENFLVCEHMEAWENSTERHGSSAPFPLDPALGVSSTELFPICVLYRNQEMSKWGVLGTPNL